MKRQAISIKITYLFWRRWRDSAAFAPCVRRRKSKYRPVFELVDEGPAGAFDPHSNLSILYEKHIPRPKGGGYVFMAEMERFARRGRRAGTHAGIETCPRHVSLALLVPCSNLSMLYKKTHPRPMAGVCFSWRRWRDSNSRGAFDPYTISNRARSTNYATSPRICSRTSLFDCQLGYYNSQAWQSQGIFCPFSGIIRTSAAENKNEKTMREDLP